jgi:hypothetical protein
MFEKLKLWLFPAEVKGFNYNAADKDGDSLVQEGTRFERKVTVVKKTAKKPAAKRRQHQLRKQLLLRRLPLKRLLKRNNDSRRIL